MSFSLDASIGLQVLNRDPTSSSPFDSIKAVISAMAFSAKTTNQGLLKIDIFDAQLLTNSLMHTIMRMIPDCIMNNSKVFKEIYFGKQRS